LLTSRNTIKALNWYWKVRVKLDDPRYADWFIKFRGFSNAPYPGGQGLSVNGSFHVPVCDWYNNGTAPRCSGFYHDQEQCEFPPPPPHTHTYTHTSFNLTFEPLLTAPQRPSTLAVERPTRWTESALSSATAAPQTPAGSTSWIIGRM
jgi:hypothetical protein